jgi:hypothetical protein
MMIGTRTIRTLRRQNAALDLAASFGFMACGVFYGLDRFGGVCFRSRSIVSHVGESCSEWYWGRTTSTSNSKPSWRSGASTLPLRPHAHAPALLGENLLETGRSTSSASPQLD